jgi:YhcH/YjgK/YiaL family protein
MIIDRLGSRFSSASLPPRLRQALEWLRATDLRALPTGRQAIDGDHLFALVQEYTTKSAGDCRWEAHRMYTDVQFVVSGAERMGYANIADARERETYDAARDVAFFEPGEDFVTVRAGMFAIFTPDDVHAPCGAAGKPAPVRKVVVKAAIES